MNIDKSTLVKIKGMLRGRAPGFAKMVAPVYASLNWTWVSDGHTLCVPREPEILSTISKLISGISSDEGTVSTGGLLVGYEIDSNTLCVRMEMTIDNNTYIEFPGR